MANSTKADKAPDPRIEQSQLDKDKEAALARTQIAPGIEEKPAGKAETRLYQTGPDKKEWLTKAEAEKQGRYWKN